MNVGDKIHVEDDLIENFDLYKLHYWEDVCIDDMVSTLLMAIKDVVSGEILKKKKQCLSEVINWSPKVIGNKIKGEIETLIKDHHEQKPVRVYT